MRLENVIMLILAFVINIFVVCVFADGFYDPNLPPVEIGLESAGEHLAERFGAPFKYAWAIGLLAAGQVATLTLTYAGQIVMTGLLDIKVAAGWRMMATRLVALVPTVIMAVVFETSQTFDYAAQLLNVAQSVLLPFALLPVLRMTADQDIMGERFVSPRWLTIIGSVICSVVLAINGYLIVDVFRVTFQSSSHGTSVLLLALLLAATMISYYLLAAYFAIGPDHWEGWWEGWVKRRGPSTLEESEPLQSREGDRGQGLSASLSYSHS